MADDLNHEDLELLEELGVDTTPEEKGSRTPREQRIIAGFEEVQKFVEEHGRLPEHGENRDIFERLYAVRLEQIRKSPECMALLKDMDSKGILAVVGKEVAPVSPEEVASDDKALLEALGVGDEPLSDITTLTHVRSRDEIQTAEEVAQRNPCKEFGVFKPLFEQVQQELQNGIRKVLKYKDFADIKKGDFFILDGQKVYVEALGEKFISNYDRPDRRLRVIYDNGTESDILLRSLQRALNKDKASRRITDPDMGPLFSGEKSEDDLEVGYIYVLRSNSQLPFIVENRKVIHKIGVTGGSVEQRIAIAEKDPTYLLASVEVVATYKLSNLNRTKLENVIHRFFDKARLDLQLKDRFGSSVEPREWFLVPLPAIEEAIQHIMDGTIEDFHYDPSLGKVAGYSDKGNS
jgi:hypothetical protein